MLWYNSLEMSCIRRGNKWLFFPSLSKREIKKKVATVFQIVIFTLQFKRDRKIS